jgi:DNA-3-methyladenine glycosylase
MEIDFSRKLPISFYLQDTISVANQLIGKIIVKIEKNSILAGKIVEVEAYTQSKDEASHSFVGITKRNKAMFETGGILYVYFIYGKYFCANIVTNKKNIGDAVLLRAVEPLFNLEQISLNRYGRKNITNKQKVNLTNGPGKFCAGFGINTTHNFVDLTSDSIFILDGKEEKMEIGVSERIGINKSKELQRRFYLKGSQFLSR